MSAIDMQELGDSIYQAMEASFEGLGFFELTPDDSPGYDPSIFETCIWARVTLSRPFTGSCMVILPYAIAQGISESIFLPIGEEVTEQAIADTVGETANTVAGRLICSLAPHDIDIAFGLPETGTGQPPIGNAQVFKYLTDEEAIICAAVLID